MKTYLQLLIFSLICATACLDAMAYSGGNGTYKLPYKIATKQDLLELAGKPSDYGKYFIQTADITLTGTSFERALIAPDATGNGDNSFAGATFTGSYDGGNYIIYSLQIEASGSASCLGLFGQISGTAKNIVLANCLISAESGNRIGGICGSSSVGAQIRDCYVAGQITGGDYGCGGISGNNHGTITRCAAKVELVAGNYHSGGLCGYNTGSILSSSSLGSVAGGAESVRIGGLCGKNAESGIIQQCFSECSVNGSATVGGLCGSNIGEITDCFARGESKASGSNCGGFCGSNGQDGTNIIKTSTLERCYSTGPVSGVDYTGGFCGANYTKNIKSSFWDIQTSGMASDGYLAKNATTANGKNTVLMKSQSTFTDWDFTSVWQMNGYPVLRAVAEMPEIPVASIALEGEHEVDEGGSVSFACLAYYFDGSSEDVTGVAVWSVDQSNFGSVSNGVVTAFQVPHDTTIFVIAEYQGHMVSNALKIIDIPPPKPPYSESFEDGLGMWKNMEGGDTLWIHTDEPTPSASSGPDSASDEDWYLYVDATDNNPAYSAGLEAEFDFTYSAEPQLTFDYHMYGQDMGSLHVDLFDGNSWHSDMWSIAGQQHSSATQAWSSATIDLNSFGGKSLVKIRLRALTGSGPRSDIAVDNVRLSNANSYSGGSGSAEDPYLIANKTDLLALSYNSLDYTKHFRQIANIDLQGDIYRESIIAGDLHAAPFSGSYDGGGYQIENLTFKTDDDSWYDALGLFGYISGAELRDLALPNARVIVADMAENVGVLCGLSVGSSISNCSATAVHISCTNAMSVGGLIGALDSPDYDPAFDESVDHSNQVAACWVEGFIQVSGTENVGGVIGYCGGGVINTHADIVIQCVDVSSSIGGVAGATDAYAALVECFATGIITGIDAESVGGLCGVNAGGITGCHSAVDITNTCDMAANIGGLCGINGDPFSFASAAVIANSYATGQITIDGSFDSVGGLCGANLGQISTSYSQGNIECTGLLSFSGGLCGINEGIVNNSFTVSTVECFGEAQTLGGLCGGNFESVSNCFSTGYIWSGLGATDVGGFCGRDHGTIEGCFWDIYRSGLSESAGGTGKTTAEMGAQSLFTDAGWDFAGESVNGTDDYWIMDEYPVINGLPFNYEFPADDLPDLILILLTGSNAVNETESIQFNMTAYYEDQSAVDVTAKTSWSVEPWEYAEIDQGELTAGLVSSNISVSVVGSFGNFAVTQQVTIVNRSIVPYVESFETGFGLWVPVAGDFDWVRWQGLTPSPATGPSGASDGSSYLLADADSNPYKTAIIEAEFDFSDTAHPMLTFDYHMFGAYAGSLHVDVSNGSVWSNDLFLIAGQQNSSESDPWHVQEVDLSSFAGESQVIIRFRAVTGVNFMGDVGIDNIRLSDKLAAFKIWLVAQGVPPALQGVNASPSGDGIPNLLKYACGLSPMLTHTTADLMMITNTPAGRFGIIYDKSKQAQNVTLEAVWSTSPAGPWTNADTTSELLDETALFEVWRTFMPVVDKGFMRLRATEY